MFHQSPFSPMSGPRKKPEPVNNLIGMVTVFGYEITDSVNGKVYYKAGNHKLSSENTITDLSDKNVVPFNKIEKFATKTGKEIAKEYGVKFLGLCHDVDEEQSIKELLNEEE